MHNEDQSFCGNHIAVCLGGKDLYEYGLRHKSRFQRWRHRRQQRIYNVEFRWSVLEPRDGVDAHDLKVAPLEF